MTLIEDARTALQRQHRSPHTQEACIYWIRESVRVRAREASSEQLARPAARRRAELTAGRGKVDLPQALREKMPCAAKSLAWQYVFPVAQTAIQKGARLATHIVERSPLAVISLLER